MFKIDDTINAFRRGVLDIDCKRMVLTQNKETGECFEGPGYIRQDDSGALTFKTYVTNHNAKPFGHLKATSGSGFGKLYGDDVFYSLEATGHDGTCWTAAQILPAAHWDATDMTVLMGGKMQLMVAHLNMPKPHHYLRLHFFEEYEVPLLKMSEAEKHGNHYYILDHAEFESYGAKFEVRQRKGSGDTVIELTSEMPLPIAFDLRIQEALQYLTAKSAFWRARLQSHDQELNLELSSPWPKSAHTKFSPPISPASPHFRGHGWRLFGTYLAYVARETQGSYWNSIAYHLYNACEATTNSVDARAVGISVAVEAVTSLIAIGSDGNKVKELADYQSRALQWLSEQTGVPPDIVERAKGQIKAMGNKRVQDTLYVLAKSPNPNDSQATISGRYGG